MYTTRAPISVMLGFFHRKESSERGVVVTLLRTSSCSRARAFGSGSGRSHSVALTTFSPVLIAARIMWMNSRVKSYRSGGGHWEVVETLVQSAAVYSAALASLLGTYLAGSNAQYVCLDILQPLIVSPASDVVVIV